MADTFAPEVQHAVTEINNTFPQLGKGGTYPGHGEDEPGGLSSQYYAADFWTTDKAVHDRVLHWSIANAIRLNLKYIISWKRIWSVARASEGIRVYGRYGPDANPSQAHTNHVHISFNEEGFYMPSLEDIRKVIREELPGVWNGKGVDMFVPPPGEATTANATWKPKSELEWLVENVDAIRKAIKP